MIVLIIPEKITEEQLFNGKTIEIVYETQFNNKRQIKTFPNDFTQEEQFFFKKVYDDAVYGSELNTHIYKCKRINNNIIIETRERFGVFEDNLQIVDNTHILKFVVTKYGFQKTSVNFELLYGENFTQEAIDLLLTIGITVSGISNNFEVLTQSCDVCFEILKESTDSYINLDNFENGKTIILHE
jgi:hypothetical protein